MRPLKCCIKGKRNVKPEGRRAVRAEDREREARRERLELSGWVGGVFVSR